MGAAVRPESHPTKVAHYPKFTSSDRDPDSLSAVSHHTPLVINAFQPIPAYSTGGVSPINSPRKNLFSGFLQFFALFCIEAVLASKIGAPSTDSARSTYPRDFKPPGAIRPFGVQRSMFGVRFFPCQIWKRRRPGAERFQLGTLNPEP
jgi:hypothetical protein